MHSWLHDSAQHFSSIFKTLGEIDIGLLKNSSMEETWVIIKTISEPIFKSQSWTTQFGGPFCHCCLANLAKPLYIS